MLVGWHTRAATIVLWVIVVSIQARNNHVTYGADSLMRVVLFWSMFLPLGARWSFDSEHSIPPARHSISSIATFGLIFQCALMYLFTALQKSGSTWRESYDAVYYALGSRDLSTWLGEWTFQHAPQELFTAFTMGTLWMEFTVPIMLLAPVRAGWLRMIAVACVFALHLGIGVNMSVGLFPALSIASILVVVPTSVWSFAFSSKFACRFQDNRVPRESRYVQSMSGELNPVDSRVLGILPTSPIAPSSLTQIAVNLVAVAAIAMSLMWNLTTVSAYSLPEHVRRTAVVTGMYQDWGMFAPNPRQATTWFILEGDISAGENVDLMMPMIEDDYSLQLAPEWDQSDDVLLQNERWRKYFWASQSREDDGLKMAGYICRNWNAANTGNDRLETVTFTVASSTTLPNGERAEPAYRHIETWYCS